MKMPGLALWNKPNKTRLIYERLKARSEIWPGRSLAMCPELSTIIHELFEFKNEI